MRESRDPRFQRPERLGESVTQHMPELRRQQPVVLVGQDVARSDDLFPWHLGHESTRLVADPCGGLANSLQVPGKRSLVEPAREKGGFRNRLKLAEDLAGERND